MSKAAEKAATTILAVPFVVLFFVAIYIPVAIYYGWALTKVWAMVAVPVFGADPLHISQAIGVTALVGMLKSNRVKQKDHEDDTTSSIIVTVVAPLISMLVAWCAMQFYPVS